uniref:Uncharacterized protein n=1 Tax=Chromera velia CCMP2878 TaxID=1169474 RepID=A0A0G4HW86_9ALVE|eukprot:Cvel_9005.t1-p1 / transcript=Cvel_9005.t1 / gene=Cvel_9005 / organism=Chromera_velia_CCMP2878 / gene_product=hypothetical protein / transcript_product=hypothetical protein / location=Cvel_scaffold509:70908-77120(-) / protein_length=742 / sequence_SO=supercontig / SO=protein_coding / is_pseudo=false
MKMHSASMVSSLCAKRVFPPSSAVLRASYPLMNLQRRDLHTPNSRRAVRMEDVRVDHSKSYPTLCNGGIRYNYNIFGLKFPSDLVLRLQEYVWNRESFLPSHAAGSLEGTPFEALERIVRKMPVVRKEDGQEEGKETGRQGGEKKTGKGRRGLLARNELRREVVEKILPDERLFPATMSLLETFKATPSSQTAQAISDVSFWTQWLIRGVLFEGKLHGEQYTEPVIPAPLSKIAFATNAALGRHQIEFVYDDYTLKDAKFPLDVGVDEVDYSSAKEIVKFVAKIDTQAAFLNERGGSPEHNFRHVHSLMEAQMRGAFEGWRQIVKGQEKGEKEKGGIDGREVLEGWHKLAKAAERSHKVFNTMLINTPAESYPEIRLPIKGVRGGCGSVYPPFGVFYQGCGADRFGKEEGAVCGASGGYFAKGAGEETQRERGGCFVDAEFGQTGANSSMFKFFDVFCGVSEERRAFSLTSSEKKEVERILTDGLVGRDGRPVSLGEDPLTAMQRAFDLLTRPALHLGFLVEAAEDVGEGSGHAYAKGGLGLLKSDNELREAIAFQRLRLTYFVARHRYVHGLYVYKMIYGTQPVGNQSRAMGTGGSTPPFLSLFFEQTRTAFERQRSALLGLGRKEALTAFQWDALDRMAKQLEANGQSMAEIRDTGLNLEREEREERRMMRASAKERETRAASRESASDVVSESESGSESESDSERMEATGGRFALPPKTATVTGSAPRERQGAVVSAAG